MNYHPTERKLLVQLLWNIGTIAFISLTADNVELTNKQSDLVQFVQVKHIFAVI